jgi:CHAT domain/NACHT domain
MQRDILIRVYGRSGANGGYPVDATLDDDSYFPGGELNIPEEELLKLNLDVQPYGARLGQCLFTAPIRRAFEKAYATVSSQTAAQMRMRLSIDADAADLHALPWERLFLQWQGSAIPLAASSLVPFSRYIPLEEGQQNPIEERPIRLLLAVANPTRLPSGLEHIDAEAQLRSLTSAIAGIPDISVTLLPGRTPLQGDFKNCATIAGPTTLDRLIDAAGRHHIVHLLCHGTFDGQTASLFLEKEDGDFAKAVDTDITAGIAALSEKPKLIYLSACDSANQNVGQQPARPFIGLAPKLVRAGVPAVVAMQTQVEIETARKLAAAFYAKVLDYGEVDRALSEARFEIYNAKSPEWAIPVLFLRLKNGRLFTTDPVREAIQAMLASVPAMDDRFYLPLEAVSLKGRDLIRDWERTTNEQRTGADLWQSIQEFRPGMTVIAGNAGTGKSMILRRLARGGGTGLQPVQQRIVALLVDMRDYANVRAAGGGRARNLIYESFRKLATSLSETKFDALFSANDGILFRFMFDGTDELPDNVRREALKELEQLAADSPHQFLLGIDCRLFEPSDDIKELLVIQPLSPRKVVRFLTPVDDSPDECLRGKLLDAIREAELFELAAMPWLLLHMLDRVKRVLPRSRVMVLEDWVDTALYSVAPDGGRKSRAKESLYALGWKMHSERRLSLPMEDAFEVLREVRSQREYNLEELLDQLVRSGMLVRVGEEVIRFAYPALQGYCAACALLNHPRRSSLIDEVVATLGQLNRVIWWGRALSLLAGMMADPIPLLQPLVYGASLTQGEQVFVAAECLLEHERALNRLTDDATKQTLSQDVESLRQQVCAALLWRTKRVNEFRFTYRERAVDALGLFRRAETIPALISLAVDPLRSGTDGEAQFEYSPVRFAAIRALRRMRDQVKPEMLAGHPHATGLIAAWEHADTDALTELMKDEDEGLQGAAAFVLGDLQSPESAQALYAAFRDPAIKPSTLWAVTDAIRALEPAEAMAELILPFIADTENVKPSKLPTGPVYERLIYLIGELRTHEPRAMAFVSRYLSEPVDGRLKGRALSALGKLHAVDAAKAQRWEAAIQGDFEGIVAVGDPNPMFLRRKAIEAVGELGDIDLLYRARQNGEWVPELDEAFFRAAEACLTGGARPVQQLEQKTGESGDGSKRLYAGGI